MPWISVGSLVSPVVAAGQADSATSVPVVLAEDQEVILNEIQAAVSALAAAKGIAADLRVTVLNPTGTAVTISSGTVTTVASLTNLAQIGGSFANTMIANLNNQAAIQGFVANIGRS